MTLAALLLLAGALAPIELRGPGVSPINDPIVAISAKGVEIGGDTPRIISWDLVRRVLGENQAPAAEFADLSEKIWRARARMERGDRSLAEPLFEELFADSRAGEGPTGLVVAEGLLRCRLDRSDQIGAMSAWLAAVRLRDAGFAHPADAPRPQRARRGPPRDESPSFRPIDDSTNLAWALPPVWIDSPETRTMILSLERGAASSGASSPPDPVADSLRGWFLFSARRETGVPASPPIDAPEVAAHPGVRFISQVVAARCGDGEARRRAREALERDLDSDLGSWREAWRREAIGRSLLAAEDPADRRRGVVQLLHVPARFTDSQPYLAGVALAEASRELADQGDSAGAASLREELVRRHPDHPAIEWLDKPRPSSKPK